MRNSVGNIFYSALIIAIVTVLIFGIAAVAAADSFHNGQYGYEINIPRDWPADPSGYPNTVVCSLGKGGRFIIEVIPQAESGKPSPDETAASVKGCLETNFADFSVRSEGWSRTSGGLDSYDINFEFSIDNEAAVGKARVVFGDAAVLLLYYDDKLDFEYYVPNVQAAFDSLAIDKSLIDRNPRPVMSPQAKPVDFIDPLKCVYRNETFGYVCDNPGRLTPKEVGGPGWVTFSTGVGEIAIRYLDAYHNSPKSPEVFVKEMLPEILVSFSRYEMTSEQAVKLNDGRAAYLVEVKAVFNGADWKGSFVGLVSDDEEPFLVSLLSPSDEYESNKGGFDVLWRNLRFPRD